MVALAAPINGFAPNLNILVQKYSGPQAMAEVAPLIKGDLMQTFPDLRNYEDTIYTMGGKEVGRIEYDASNSGFLLHFCQIFFISSEKYTGITITDKADHFSMNQDIRDIKASMKIH